MADKYRKQTEIYSRSIDLVQYDDGTWGADEFTDADMRSTRRVDYPSRAAVLRAIGRPAAWKPWPSRPTEK